MFVYSSLTKKLGPPSIHFVHPTLKVCPFIKWRVSSSSTSYIQTLLPTEIHVLVSLVFKSQETTNKFCKTWMLVRLTLHLKHENDKMKWRVVILFMHATGFNCHVVDGGLHSCVLLSCWSLFLLLSGCDVHPKWSWLPLILCLFSCYHLIYYLYLCISCLLK